MSMAPRWISHRALWPMAASLAAACSQSSSATDLHPEGPPMVEQVLMMETITSSGSISNREVFGFGSHADATPDIVHPVAAATATGNKFRVVMDELLRGNNLEEIACRVPVDADQYARVPLGATPDDIARCSVVRDLLPARCPGRDPRSVCLCANDDGCLNGVNTDGTPHITPRGESVGVLDTDFDGAADDTRFIQGAVGIRCGAFDVPIDLDNSYWNPSGDQQTPAQGGFDALGPAIVLVPGPTTDVALPTNLDCAIAFSSDVVDKDGNQVCAPVGGDISAGCTPGDTSAFRFHVEPMTFDHASPLVPPPKRTDDFLIRANAPIDPATLPNITVTEDPATSYTQFTAMLTVTNSMPVPNQITIRWTAPGGLAANTRYTITVPTTVTDRYHQSPLQASQIAFTTGAN
jgi:hypothetical protein